MNWKGQAIQVGLFLVLPLLGALGTLAALRWRRVGTLSPARWTALAVTAFLLTRAGTHLLAFHVLGWTGGGDLERVWLPAARAALEFRDPVPHLDNLYGPLFPWTLAAGLGLTGGRYAPGMDALFVVAEAVLLVLLARLARPRLGEGLSRRLVLAVLLSPLLWFDTVVQTQEESLFACGVLVVLLLLDGGRERIAAGAAAAGTLLTKALFPFWVLPVLLAAGGGWRRVLVRVAAAGGLTVGALAAAVALGWNPLGLVRGNINVYGTSSWLLFVGAKSLDPSVVAAGLAGTALAATLAAGAALRRREGEDAVDRAARGVVAAQAAYVVLTPFLLTAHVTQGLPLLAWFAVRQGACDPRPSGRATALAMGLALWQVPALAVKAEHWHLHPALLAAWVGFWGWTGWLAWTAPAGAGAPSERPVPAG